jgi:hypothetical protein
MMHQPKQSEDYKVRTNNKEQGTTTNLIFFRMLYQFWESLIIQHLPNVNGVGLPRVVRLCPQTWGKPRR